MTQRNFFIFIAIVLLSFTVTCVAILALRQSVQVSRQKCFTEGQAAAKAGIPPTANPRIRYPNDAAAWLEGYMSAKNSQARENSE